MGLLRMLGRLSGQSSDEIEYCGFKSWNVSL